MEQRSRSTTSRRIRLELPALFLALFGVGCGDAKEETAAPKASGEQIRTAAGAAAGVAAAAAAAPNPDFCAVGCTHVPPNGDASRLTCHSATVCVSDAVPGFAQWNRWPKRQPDPLIAAPGGPSANLYPQLYGANANDFAGNQFAVEDSWLGGGDGSIHAFKSQAANFDANGQPVLGGPMCGITWALASGAAASGHTADAIALFKAFPWLFVVDRATGYPKQCFIAGLGQPTSRQLRLARAAAEGAMTQMCGANLPRNPPSTVTGVARYNSHRYNLLATTRRGPPDNTLAYYHIGILPPCFCWAWQAFFIGGLKARMGANFRFALAASDGGGGASTTGEAILPEARFLVDDSVIPQVQSLASQYQDPNAFAQALLGVLQVDSSVDLTDSYNGGVAGGMQSPVSLDPDMTADDVFAAAGIDGTDSPLDQPGEGELTTVLPEVVPLGIAPVDGDPTAPVDPLFGF